MASVTSAQLDMTITNNGTWSDAVQFGAPSGYSWNLNGQSFEMDVQRDRYDEIPLLQLSTANGRIVVADAMQRVIYFNVEPLDIQNSLKPGIYVYDLVMVSTSTPPVRVPLLHGSVVVTQGVTYTP